MIRKVLISGALPIDEQQMQRFKDSDNNLTTIVSVALVQQILLFIGQKAFLNVMRSVSYSRLNFSFGKYT